MSNKLHIFAGAHKIIPQLEDRVRNVNTADLGVVRAIQPGGVWVTWNGDDSRDFYRWRDFDKHVEVLL